MSSWPFFLIFFCFYGFTLRSVITTNCISSTSSSVSLSLQEVDREKRYGKILHQYYAEFYDKTNFIVAEPEQDFHLRIFSKAIKHAAGPVSDFTEVILNPKINLEIHCFLLGFFTRVFKKENGHATYSQFLQFYTATLYEKRSEIFQVSPQTIQTFVFPLLKDLVGTGNFLNYSMLFPVLRCHFNAEIALELFKIHMRQYFERESAESFLEHEVFKHGLDLLNLYS